MDTFDPEVERLFERTVPEAGEYLLFFRHQGDIHRSPSLLDFSYGGVSFRSPLPLFPGERIEVGLRNVRTGRTEFEPMEVVWSELDCDEQHTFRIGCAYRTEAAA